MVALDSQNQPIEPASEVSPTEALGSYENGSSSVPPQETVAAAPLIYPEQLTGRVMDFIV
ncbi:MAG: hypothetical protein KKE73_10445 [Proteobacteria bacterium]|nr:hypothetical protein [Pseudomonadota bacterium]